MIWFKRVLGYLAKGDSIAAMELISRNKSEWESHPEKRTVEAAIVSDPEWAYYYASEVIGDRWPEGEPAIMRSPEWAYWYALDIRGRWPEGEPAIATDARCSYYYAIDVIGGRWPEGEPVIATDPMWAYYYARDVVKGRWPEAEDVIRSSMYVYDYEELFESRGRLVS